MTTYISQLIADLNDSAATDIFTDAPECQDAVDSARNAMSDAAVLLKKMKAAYQAMWVFASALVEKHGMDGDDTLTDDEHLAWQDVGGTANAILSRKSLNQSEEIPSAPVSTPMSGM